MKIKTRIHAFLTHLLASLIILVLTLSSIFFLWFPKELIYAGGISGLKIIIGVDLILGPLLTFIVYKPNKKGLMFDLLIIGSLQIGCLFYGLWLIYNQRPVLEVTSNDGVHLISASDAKFYGLDLNKIPGKRLKRVMMKLPKDESQWGAVVFASEFTDNKPFSLQNSLYLSMGEVTQQKFEERIRILSKNKPKTKPLKTIDKNCKWVTVFSVHLASDSLACVNKKHGIVKISQ